MQLVSVRTPTFDLLNDRVIRNNTKGSIDEVPEKSARNLFMCNLRSFPRVENYPS